MRRHGEREILGVDSLMPSFNWASLLVIMHLYYQQERISIKRVHHHQETVPLVTLVFWVLLLLLLLANLFGLLVQIGLIGE